MRDLLIIKRSAKAVRFFNNTVIILAVALLMALLAGCTSPASSTAGTSPSLTPVPTTQPESAPTAGNASPEEELGEDANAITQGDWVYYLDVNDPVVVNYSEDPPLHMRKTDGSGDVQLGIRGFRFDIIGDYIYLDSNDPDLDANGTQVWNTTRMKLDGSEKRVLEYGSMSLRLRPEGEQKFYFTTMGDSAVYISDFACENVETLVLNLPDKSEIDGKLGTDKLLQVDISEVKNGSINFEVTFSNSDGIELYSGSYKTTTDGKTVEKVKGTYYSYSSQNESD